MNTTTHSARADEILARATVCDMIFVYEPPVGNDWRVFPLYRKAGVDFIQVHPAGDGHNIGEAIRLIAQCRRDIAERGDECVFVETVTDIRRAKAEGKLAVSLQLEGFRCLERDLNMVDLYYALGVRLCHPIHNVVNSIGGGCADGDDLGLTNFGRDVVARMNEVGMIVDGAHCGHRVQLDMLEVSSQPVVYSHHGVHGVHAHIRNLKDDVIRGCAARGGVVGITGAGFYLGGPPTAELLFRHLDYAVALVGPEHVGIALDYFGDFEDQRRFMQARPNLFPGLNEGAWEPVSFAPPGVIRELTGLMVAAGYGEPAILDILGENWLRICAQVWR